MSFGIYPIVFSISCGLLHLSEKTKRKQKFILVTLALLIPAIVSGCRDYSMGYDVEHYGNRYFEMAIQYDFFDYMKWMIERQIEPLYALLNKIVSYFTSNPHVLYGIQTFIILVLIYAVVEENNYPADACLLAFWGFMFVDSFNVLRQYLAMAVVLYSYVFIKRKQFVRYVICIAVAMGFHFMAIVGFSLWPIYYGIVKLDGGSLKDVLKNSKKVKKRILLVSVIVSGMVFSFNNISGMLIASGILPARYIAYGTDISTSINITGTLSRIPLLILVYIFYKQKREKSTEIFFFIILLILEIVLIQLKTLGSVFLRIAYIFGFFKILVVGKLCSRKLKNRTTIERVNIMRLGTYLYVILYFILVYFIVSNEGYYSSMILGIG